MADGAKCTLTDARGRKWKLKRSPGTVAVEDGHSPMQVICTKPGYKNTVETVREQKEELLTIDGKRVTMGPYDQFPTKAPRLIPTAIKETASFALDPTGNISTKYPEKITIWMEPESWQSEEEMRQWAYEREVWENGDQLVADQEKAIDDERKTLRREKKLARKEARKKTYEKYKNLLTDPETYVDAAEDGTKKVVTGVKTVVRSVGAGAGVVGSEIGNTVEQGANWAEEKASEMNPDWAKNNPNIKPSSKSALEKKAWKPNWITNGTGVKPDQKPGANIDNAIKKIEEPKPAGDVPPWILEKNKASGSVH
ncbi:MAG: hypothetical protein K0R98_1318 [Rickettsiaceae bacterium]|nr:hypothetical protein [Rickettsiaceae bacterium]